jgi:stress response protein YsnF
LTTKITSAARTVASLCAITIEVTETIEEPVVTKSVHIAEEVVIRKEATDTVTTLRDKVRRQQVEIEKIPGNGPSSRKR